MAMPDKVILIRLLGDEPPCAQEACGLDREGWARVVAGIALGTDGPFTVGLYGGWGTGKTSLLHRVQELASTGKDTEAFVVNAWEHENSPDPLRYLVADILEQIDERLETVKEPERGGKLKKIRETLGNKKVWSGIKLAANLASLGLGLPLALPVAFAKEGVETASAAAEVAGTAAELGTDPKAGHDMPVPVGLRTKLRDQWKLSIPDMRIVICIDDLDRCHPDAALRLLEAIKHVLWTSGFVFVLALDPEVITKHLQHRYETEYGIKDDPTIGKRFLEKLVQVTVPLPMGDNPMEKYIAGLIESFRGSQPFAYGALKGLEKVIARGARKNPREAKRLLNDILLDMAVWQAMHTSREDEFDHIEAACLVTWRLVGRVWPVGLCDLFAEGQDLCIQLAVKPAENIPTSETEAFGQAGVDETKLTAVDLAWKKIQDAGLQTLFAEEGIGRFWAGFPEIRQATRDFLRATREEQASEKLIQREIVETGIRKSLMRNENEPLTDRDYKAARHLDLQYSGVSNIGLQLLENSVDLVGLVLQGTEISDLSHLSNLKGLKGLDLQGTKVLDLSPLSELVGLTTLYLSDTQISDISVLSRLKSLKCIDLRNTAVSNFSLLSELTELTTVFLSNTEFSDLSLLSGLQSLKRLYLSNTNITSLSDLSGLMSLKRLYLSHTQVSDISPLSELKSLTRLHLSDTNILKLAALSGLNSLEKLYLSNTLVKDLSPLSELKQLEELYLDGTQIRDLSPLKGCVCLKYLVIPMSSGIDTSILGHLTELKVSEG